MSITIGVTIIRIHGGIVPIKKYILNYKYIQVYIHFNNVWNVYPQLKLIPFVDDLFREISQPPMYEGSVIYQLTIVSYSVF